MGWYLRHLKHPKLKFKIVELDKATKKAKLMGDTGVPFEQSLTPENLAKFGYEVVKMDDANEQPAA